MILEIEPLESGSTAKCHHRRCDGRSAKWRFLRLTRALQIEETLSCSVHIPHFCEIFLESDTTSAATVARSTVHIERANAAKAAACGHPRCDGRRAKWRFPQTRHLVTGEHQSCSVHIARFCEIVLKYHAVEVPINAGRRRRQVQNDAAGPLVGQAHVA